MSELLDRYSAVVDRVRTAAAGADRSPEDVTLVAVSKGRDVSTIRRLYDLGHRDFGENRAQELREKVPELPGDIRWHFIGPLQTNKVRIVRPAVHALHSLDRMSLATAWMKGAGSPPVAYLQVNIGAESQKSGVAVAEVDETLDRLERLSVPVVGLMTIPPLVDEPEESRRHFVALRELRDRAVAAHPDVAGLSMGMTNDFDIAVAEGATAIRVGRAIFQD
ncbi:MAG: YggS family pyridoxal phosphate-dependent enzyme [Acidimicrobiia bacterium]|nr:YggS family pyridoxal phosphate-dependent enzyme [Acidimicrobiia bacterium]